MTIPLQILFWCIPGLTLSAYLAYQYLSGNIAPKWFRGSSDYEWSSSSASDAIVAMFLLSWIGVSGMCLYYIIDHISNLCNDIRNKNINKKMKSSPTKIWK